MRTGEDAPVCLELRCIGASISETEKYRLGRLVDPGCKPLDRCGVFTEFDRVLSSFICVAGRVAGIITETESYSQTIRIIRNI